MEEILGIKFNFENIVRHLLCKVAQLKIHSVSFTQFSEMSKFRDFDTLMPRGVLFGEFQASQNILFPTAKDEWNPKIEEEKNVLALVNILYCSVT